MMPLRLILLVMGFSMFWITPVLALQEGTPAPGFSLDNLKGQAVRLEQLKGRPVLLKLGASWCPGCRQQSAEINQLADFLQQRDIAVVDIFLQDNESDIRAYYNSFDEPVPELALLGDTAVRKAYQVYSIPRLLLLDRQGKIQFDRGYIPDEELRQQLELRLN